MCTTAATASAANAEGRGLAPARVVCCGQLPCHDGPEVGSSGLCAASSASFNLPFTWLGPRRCVLKTSMILHDELR